MKKFLPIPLSFAVAAGPWWLRQDARPRTRRVSATSTCEHTDPSAPSAMFRAQGLELRRELVTPMDPQVIGQTGRAAPNVRFEPREIRPGGSTAEGGAVAYRLDKVAALVGIDGSWLDCGCCDGDYTVGLRDHGARRVIGSDIEPDRVAGAQARWHGREGVEFVVARAEALPFPDQEFDGVLLNEVLEHVADQERTLSELKRVLVPGGVLALFSPNRWFPFEGHGMIIGERNFSSPVPLVPWLPRGLSLRVMKARNYWPRELRGLVHDGGFEILHVGFAFPLFGKYRWLPSWAIDRYLAWLPRIEHLPVLRRFGVSTMVVARRSSDERSNRPPALS